MPSVPLQIRPATPVDAARALAWSPDEASLRRWAGPAVSWPTMPAQFWQEIATAEFRSFAFFAGEEQIGFGQVRHREARFGHLARLVVSPERQGQGFGRAIAEALLHEARNFSPLEAFSLYVQPGNDRALALYRRLGFVDQGIDPQTRHHLLLAPPFTASGSQQRHR